MPRKVWINIPAYTGQIYAETFASLIADIALLQARGDEVQVRAETQNCYLADARAILVERFLEGDAETFVFIDADVSWAPGKLVQLIDQPRDCRLGVYPYRADLPDQWPVRWDIEKADLYADPETGMLPILGGPTGFMALSRNMLEIMRDHYFDKLDVIHDGLKRGAFCALFSDYWVYDEERKAHRKFGDDYAFCQRWLDIGGRIWAQPETPMGHTGMKTYRGSLGEWLRGRINA